MHLRGFQNEISYIVHSVYILNMDELKMPQDAMNTQVESMVLEPGGQTHFSPRAT